MKTWQKKIPFLKDPSIACVIEDPSCLCTLIELNHTKVDWLTEIVVQEGQLALFIADQQIVAILEKGTYPWNWVFSALPTSDMSLYYFSTKTFADQRFGTATPIMIQDPTSGIFSLRAHGAFSYQLQNPKKLWQHIPSGTQTFLSAEILTSLRAIILEELAITLNNQPDLKSILQDRAGLAHTMHTRLATLFSNNYGLQLDDFIIQSISFSEKETSSLESMAKLEKLNALYKQGILSQEEFEEKKKAILKDL